MLTPEAEVMRIAFDQGVNYVDTARGYMGGSNEEIVGKALKGRRDKVYVRRRHPRGRGRTSCGMSRQASRASDGLHRPHPAA